MKAIKFLLAAVLAMVLSTPLSAQEANYQEMIKPIDKALKTNNADQLKALVKDYNKIFKKNPKALVALGNTYLLNKHFDEAKLVAEQVVAKNKTYGDAYCLLGDIEAMKDEGGNAAMWYRQAMTMDPKNPQGYMSLANVYRKRDPEEAAKAYEMLKQVRPDYPIEAEAAHTFYQGGQYKRAYDAFAKTDKAQLEDWRLAEFAVSAYMDSKKEEALELATFGAAKFPTNVTFRRIGLWAAADTEKYPEALMNAEAVMADTCKKSARDYIYYGLALKGNKQFEKAIEQFQTAFAMNDKDFKPYQYISDTYAAAGDEDKALEWSEKYMNSASTTTPSDYAKLAGIYLQKAGKGENVQANYDKAFSIYESMGKKFPSISYYANLQAANAAFQAELDDQAMIYYGRVIKELEAKQCDESELGALKAAYKNYGYIIWNTKKDLNGAYPYFEKLLKLDPQNALAKQAVEAKHELDSMPAEEEVPAE